MEDVGRELGEYRYGNVYKEVKVRVPARLVWTRKKSNLQSWTK